VTGTGAEHSADCFIDSFQKLAENLDALVLDVKFGTAAFMQTKADARQTGARDGFAGQ